VGNLNGIAPFGDGREPDGNYLASCSDDKTVKIWGDDAEPIHTLTHDNKIYSLTWSKPPKGSTLPLMLARCVWPIMIVALAIAIGHCHCHWPLPLVIAVAVAVAVAVRCVYWRQSCD
jgi:hypothetical protein